MSVTASKVAVERHTGKAGLLVLLCAGAVILWLGHGLIFLSDEWTFISWRRDWNADAFLKPHNEHLHALPALIYKLLFSTVGIDDYWPYRLVQVAAHLLAVVLLFVLVRRRRGALLSACVALPLLFFGGAWEVVLWPFMLGFTGSVAAGLGALLLLDRRTRAGDGAACALLIAGAASSSLGVSIALGVLVELALDGERRRDLWVAAAPLALYALWYVAFNLDTHRGGPLEWVSAPAFLHGTASATVAGIVGAPLGYETNTKSFYDALVVGAHVLTAAAAALACWLIVVRRRRTPRLAMLVVALGSFWVLLSISRAYTDQPYASRYIYPAAFLLLLLAMELAPERVPRGAMAAIGIVALTAGVANAAWLRTNANRMRADSATLAAQLGALETTRGRVDPYFFIDHRYSGRMPAFRYFAAIDQLGPSPADSPRQILGAPERARVGADDVLERALRLGAVQYTGAARRLIDASRRGRPTGVRLERTARVDVRRDGCLTARPRAAEGRIEIALPAVGAIVDGHVVTTRLRRFAAGYGPRSVVSSGPTFLRAERGTIAVPWRALLSAGGPFTVC